MHPTLLYKTRRTLKPKVLSNSLGFTLTELLITLVFSGILLSLAGPLVNSTFGARPLDDSLNRVAGTLNLMRVKATSQTLAYRMRIGSSSNIFLVEYATSCTAASSAWQSDTSFMAEDRTLGKNVTFYSVTPNPAVSPWSVCFDDRGMADRSLDVRLADSTGAQRRVQVFQGGSIQIY